MICSSEPRELPHAVSFLCPLKAGIGRALRAPGHQPAWLAAASQPAPAHRAAVAQITITTQIHT